MKIIYILLAFGMLLSCGKRFEHNFYVSGTLLDNCANKLPVGGIVLSYDMNGHSFATATTDAYGHFELEGTAKERNGFNGSDNVPYLVFSSDNQPGGSAGGAGYIKLAYLPLEGAVLDTLYEHMTYQVQINIINKGQYTEKDTLFLQYSPPFDAEDNLRVSSFSTYYNKKYPGPFKNGILDTLPMEGQPHPVYPNGSSAGTVTYYINGNYPDGDKEVVFAQPLMIDAEKNVGGCDRITPVTLELD